MIGIYQDQAQLDHDVRMELGVLLAEMDSRGVEMSVTLASLRRILRGA